MTSVRIYGGVRWENAGPRQNIKFKLRAGGRRRAESCYSTQLFILGQFRYQLPLVSGHTASPATDMLQTLPSPQLRGSCLSPTTQIWVTSVCTQFVSKYIERAESMQTKSEASFRLILTKLNLKYAHPTLVYSWESLKSPLCSLKCVRSCSPPLTCPGWVWVDIITSLLEWAPQCGPHDLIIQWWWWWWHNNHYSIVR